MRNLYKLTKVFKEVGSAHIAGSSHMNGLKSDVLLVVDRDAQAVVQFTQLVIRKVGHLGRIKSKPLGPLGQLMLVKNVNACSKPSIRIRPSLNIQQQQLKASLQQRDLP